jgi:NAD+ kinase
MGDWKEERSLHSKKETEMKKIFLVAADPSVLSREIAESLQSFFCLSQDPDSADMILALGGDGTMLKAIHKHWLLDKPFFGLNFGHLGFLMNRNSSLILEEMAHGNFDTVESRLLEAEVGLASGSWHLEYAFNDFYFRIGNCGMSARMRVEIDGVTRFDPLSCDGVIVCSAAGSTAYNASSGGAILPIGTDNMVLTGISPAIHHRFKTIQLAAHAQIRLSPLELIKRPSDFFSDGRRIDQATSAVITLSNRKVQLLFAKSENYRKKVQDIQFPDWNR